MNYKSISRSYEKLYSSYKLTERAKEDILKADTGSYSKKMATIANTINSLFSSNEFMAEKNWLCGLMIVAYYEAGIYKSAMSMINNFTSRNDSLAALYTECNNRLKSEHIDFVKKDLRALRSGRFYDESLQLLCNNLYIFNSQEWRSIFIETLSLSGKKEIAKQLSEVSLTETSPEW